MLRQCCLLPFWLGLGRRTRFCFCSVLVARLSLLRMPVLPLFLSVFFGRPTESLPYVGVVVLTARDSGDQAVLLCVPVCYAASTA